MSTDTCCRIHVARSGYMLTVSRRHNLLFIYVTVDLYPFVSNATAEVAVLGFSFLGATGVATLSSGGAHN